MVGGQGKAASFRLILTPGYSLRVQGSFNNEDKFPYLALHLTLNKSTILQTNLHQISLGTELGVTHFKASEVFKELDSHTHKSRLVSNVEDRLRLD